MENVCAALIVKNEEKFLPECLASLKGRVDEVVIVDTGSTDRTREIAVASGAKVFDFPWVNDFAAARNAGLEQVVSSWVLYIDADERLVMPKGDRLASLLDHPQAVGARLNFRPMMRGTPCREYRMFRNRRDIRFVGAIHETVVPDLDKLSKNGASEIIDIDAELVHLGYEGDLTHKYRRNLPMLRCMVVEWPARLYYWLDLAKALTGLGELVEAREICLAGLRVAVMQNSQSSKSVAALIALNLAELLYDAGEDDQAVIQQGFAFQADHPSLLFQLAKSHVKAARYADAVEALDHLIELGRHGFADPLVSFDERLFGARALELKSLALLRSGRRVEAAHAMQMASALEPADLALRVKATAVGARSW